MSLDSNLAALAGAAADVQTKARAAAAAAERARFARADGASGASDALHKRALAEESVATAQESLHALGAQMNFVQACLDRIAREAGAAPPGLTAASAAPRSRSSSAASGSAAESDASGVLRFDFPEGTDVTIFGHR